MGRSNSLMHKFFKALLETLSVFDRGAQIAKVYESFRRRQPIQAAGPRSGLNSNDAIAVGLHGNAVTRQGTEVKDIGMHVAEAIEHSFGRRWQLNVPEQRSVILCQSLC